MLRCLFWNFKYKGADKEAVAARLALFHGVDILILAESEVEPSAMLHVLNSSDQNYETPPEQHKRFRIFTRFPGGCLAPFRGDSRLSVRRLRMPQTEEVLFAVIHFYDRRNFPPQSQHSLSRDVYSTLDTAEQDAGHRRTLVVGDFNMNPFDPGMIDAGGFGALMNRNLVDRLAPDGMDGPKRFYNPMWSRLGRGPDDAPGTFYWRNMSDPLNIYWHSLDQVLIRPALFGAFRDQDFRILTSIPDGDGGTLDLVRPLDKHWGIQVSDHLPILFTLDPPAEERHHA